MRLVWLCILLVVAIGAWSTWRTFAPGAISSGSANAVDDVPAQAASTIAAADFPDGAVKAHSQGAPSAAAQPSPPPNPAPGGALPATAGLFAPASGPAPSASMEPRVVTLDDRFVVRGSGTESDPLRIPWELLVSAQETYDPQAGKTDLPSRVTQLSGQVVKITGYFAAGVLEDDTRDLIVMLNKWDGCCLGVPPTPYDAVEVRLADPVKLRGKHMLRYGTVTGRFEVSPFLVAGWLMSVYRIVDAKLEWGG